MHESAINEIMREMATVLTCYQLKQLKETLHRNLNNSSTSQMKNDDLLEMFLQAKHVEGRSLKTLEYYNATISHMLRTIDKPLCQVVSNDLRNYLSDYQQLRNSSNVTIDNIRRIFSTFFSWLEDEDYIVKSPVRRIHRIKAPVLIKATIADEDMERLRSDTACIRDAAVVNLLASTGIRIGELVKLDIADINLEERECKVFGKGNKERKAYFDARTKLLLESYLSSRNDNCPALFVSLKGSHERITIGNAEMRIRQLGDKLNISHVHPHKFRRTLATNAIAKGMAIEQVQHLLGHEKIDTTMHYAMVDQRNVKLSHRKYLG